MFLSTCICTSKQFCRFSNCCTINCKIVIRCKIFTHSRTICHFFIANKRINIVLQIAGKNPLLVGQIIVLQVFDDIHIPILYNICICFCINININLHINAKMSVKKMALGILPSAILYINLYFFFLLFWVIIICAWCCFSFGWSCKTTSFCVVRSASSFRSIVAAGRTT